MSVKCLSLFAKHPPPYGGGYAVAALVRAWQRLNLPQKNVIAQKVKPTHRNLPRLEPQTYQGLTAVHWTFGIENRAKGWLTAEFHSCFREVLVHTGIRYGCVIPVYCLMPDHIHVMFWGVREDANLYLAAKFLRKHTAQALRPACYQKQAYDHVLHEKEYERGGFEAVCFYIAENPVRAALCKSAKEYVSSNCMIPGYPDLNIHAEDYWDLFWRICHRLTAAATTKS